MRSAGTIAQMLVITGLIAIAPLGCGRKEVSARAQPPTVTRWKYSPAGSMGIPKGIVVEQRAEHVRARFCDLKAGHEFMIDSVLANGTYLQDRKALVFPLGIPDGTSVEEWLAAGGPHLSVPFEPKAPRLTAKLNSAGASQSFQFTRHQ